MNGKILTLLVYCATEQTKTKKDTSNDENSKWKTIVSNWKWPYLTFFYTDKYLRTACVFEPTWNGKWAVNIQISGNDVETNGNVNDKVKTSRETPATAVCHCQLVFSRSVWCIFTSYKKRLLVRYIAN